MINNTIWGETTNPFPARDIISLFFLRRKIEFGNMLFQLGKMLNSGSNLGNACPFWAQGPGPQSLLQGPACGRKKNNQLCLSLVPTGRPLPFFAQRPKRQNAAPHAARAGRDTTASVSEPPLRHRRQPPPLASCEGRRAFEHLVQKSRRLQCKYL